MLDGAPNLVFFEGHFQQTIGQSFTKRMINERGLNFEGVVKIQGKLRISNI